MKKIFNGIILSMFVFASFVLFTPLSALADSASVDFEPVTYTLGNVNGQDGWSSTGPFDQSVVSNTYGFGSFDSQSFRISNAITSGSFGDQTFAKPLVNAVGEVDSTNGAFSPGTVQPHFEVQFDLATTKSTQQIGLATSFSPDRGDGSRMSYLRFEDGTAGVNVFFDDVQGTGNPANFVETQIAVGLSRSVPHTIKMVMDLVDGPSNDVVKVYIDGNLVHTGTSWENYYRYDSEASAEQSPRIIKTVIIRAGGTAVPANSGEGFLFDNMSLTSEATPVAPDVKVTIVKYVDDQPATATGTSSTAFPMTATWDATNIGAGSGNYSLGPSGFNNPNPYQATTADMTSGADYSTSEITGTGSPVGLDCSTDNPYKLVGYSTGETFAEAEGNTVSTTTPSFTDLLSNKFVIVWNETCPPAPTTGSLIVNKITVGGNGHFFLNGDGGLGRFDITTTGNSGSETFIDLAPGTYHINEEALAGWTQLSSDCGSVVVTAGQTASCTVTNGKNTALGSIRGTKFIDNDGDGNIAEDTQGQGGVTIYLDLNNNGSLDVGEPTSVTNAEGEYRFNNILPNTYHVREVVPSGWVQTAPADGEYVIILGAGQIIKQKNFGNFELGTIAGMKYEDQNNNGWKNNWEPGLSGWTIVLHKPDSSTDTTITDSFGKYKFENLGPGSYTVTEVEQSGWEQTSHPSVIKLLSGQNRDGNNFGNHQLVVEPS